MLGQKDFGSKKFCSKKFWVEKFVSCPKNLGETKSWSKIFWSKEIKAWCGQMSPEQILPWQMSLWQLESVQDGPRNLHLKLG